MFKKISLLSLVILLSILACKKQTDSYSDIIVVNDNETVKASIAGIVVDEKDVPIAGAAVSSGTLTTTTDVYGRFAFSNIDISKNNGWVKVVKTGYFTGNRTFISSALRTHNLRIKLLDKKTDGTVSSSTGGSITLTNGAKLTLAANSLADAAGNPYTGTVTVSMRWLDPTAKDLAYTMPGSLRGIAGNGGERVLETYGMIGVEMSGAAGQQLQIAAGNTAALSFPIPAALQAAAPATIPLWFFDETTGRWKEEGTATKTGSTYAANVKHFTFWNCDASFPLIKLCITLTNSNGQPLNNATVRIRRGPLQGNVGYGQTDASGNVCGAVPQNELLFLDVLDLCGNAVYTQNIGPFAVDASLSVTANIPAASSINITGTLVNCNNAPVTNGYADIYVANGNFYAVPVNASGVFNFNMLTCSSSTTFSVVGIDNATQQQSNPVSTTATSGTVNVGTITACGTAAGHQYFNLLIDGIPYNWVEPTDSFIMSMGNPTLISMLAVQIRNNLLNGTTINTVPITAIGAYGFNGIEVRIDGSLGTSYTLQNPAAAKVNITECGAVGTGYIAGNYNENLIFPGGIVRHVTCYFRIKRTV